MGAQYLIDTNVVIEFLGGLLPEKGSDWMEHIVLNQEHALSAINKMELLGFKAASSELLVIQTFIADSTLLHITEAVINETIRLRQSYTIKLPDAIIAATALVHELKLVTRNTGDFKKINGLKCINCHDFV